MKKIKDFFADTLGLILLLIAFLIMDKATIISFILVILAIAYEIYRFVKKPKTAFSVIAFVIGVFFIILVASFFVFGIGFIRISSPSYGKLW